MEGDFPSIMTLKPHRHLRPSIYFYGVSARCISEWVPLNQVFSGNHHQGEIRLRKWPLYQIQITDRAHFNHLVKWGLKSPA